MQAFIFLTCMLCGVASGAVYDVLYIARVFVCGADKRSYTVKDRIFTLICDLIYFAVFAAMFIFISVCFGFYSLRLYMLVAALLGALIYLKSLHIGIAFLIKKAYNGLHKYVRSKKFRHEGRKAQQNHSGDHR